MSKRVVILLVVMLMPWLVSYNVFAENQPIEIFVDGKPIVFDVPPRIVNDRVIVPIRTISEALDLEVNWKPDLNWIHISSKQDWEKNITIFIDEDDARVDLASVDLDTPATIIDGRAFVPLRFIAEGLGADVKWDSSTRKIEIIGPKNLPFLGGKTADKTFPLINERLNINMPEGTVDQAIRKGGIMGTDSNYMKETRLIYTANDQKLVTHSYELFKYSTGDLQQDAKIFLRDSLEPKTTYVVSPTVSNQGIEYVAITPDKIEKTESTLLNGALVKLTDQTLVYVGVYANYNAMYNVEDCLEMAKNIIGSIKNGTRMLEINERSYTLYSKTINVANGYASYLDKGIDFSVYRFYKVVAIDKPQPAFGIYFGYHPSTFGSKLPVHTVLEESIGGKAVKWDIYSKKGDSFDNDTFIETLIKDENEYSHIFINPTNEAEWKIINEMIHSMK